MRKRALCLCLALAFFASAACAAAPDVNVGDVSDVGVSSEPTSSLTASQTARDALEALLAREIDDVWITESELSAVRDAVSRLTAPVLTADDVDRLACRATLFLGRVSGVDCVLPTFGPIGGAELSWGDRGTFSSANKQLCTLLFYTICLFTPSELVFQAKEIWATPDSHLGVYGATKSYCIPLAEERTGDETSLLAWIPALQAGAPFVVLFLDGATLPTATQIHPDLCGEVRTVRRDCDPRLVDSYSLLDDPMERYSFLTADGLAAFRQVVENRCVEWILEKRTGHFDKYADEAGRFFTIDPFIDAVERLRACSVPLLSADAYLRIAEYLEEVSQGATRLVCVDLDLQVDLQTYDSRSVRRAILRGLLEALTPPAYRRRSICASATEYCLPGDYATPREAFAGVNTGETPYFRALDDPPTLLYSESGGEPISFPTS